MGFDSDQFLTAENTIAALAGYFERNDITAYRLSTRKHNELKRWLFGTLIFGRYTTTPNFVEDLAELSKHGRFQRPPRGAYTENGLIGVMYAIGRRRRMTDYHGNEITWHETDRAGRLIHIDHIYPYSRLMSGPIYDEFPWDAEEKTESLGNKAFAIGETNTSKNKSFPGEKIGHVVGQWLDGVSLLKDSDYQKMKRSSSALRTNWREIKPFIDNRSKKIMRDIKLEIS